MLKNCLQSYKVSLRTLTTEDSSLTHLFHDCTNVLYSSECSLSIARYQWSVTWSVRHASLITCG